MRPRRLTDQEVDGWLAAHSSWRLVEGHLVSDWHLPSHREAAQLVIDQVPIADRLDHHAVITLVYRDVRVELWTHDRDGLTELDLAYAEALDVLTGRPET